MRASLAAITMSLLASAAAHAECPPTAIPEGDPTIIRAVSDRLSSNGIMTTGTAGCPAVRVRVEQRGERLHLRVIDAYQRFGEREVHDVATAAAVIESWTLQEVDPGTLPAPAIKSPPRAVAPTSVAAIGAARSRWTSSIGAGGRSWIGDDGSTWIGATVGGCVRVRWSCLGASVDFGQETATVEDASAGTQRSRAIHAVATADIPRKLGAFVISPGATVGYGWNRIQQQHLDMHSMPMAASHANHALRTGGHVVVSRSLVRNVALFASVFGDVAVLRTDIPDGPHGRLGFSLGARLEGP